MRQLLNISWSEKPPPATRTTGARFGPGIGVPTNGAKLTAFAASIHLASPIVSAILAPRAPIGALNPMVLFFVSGARSRN
jgi:hypothetical protein